MSALFGVFNRSRNSVEHETTPDTTQPATTDEHVTPFDMILLPSDRLSPRPEEVPSSLPPSVKSSLGKRKRSTGLYNYTIKVACSTGEEFDIHEGLLKQQSLVFRSFAESPKFQAEISDRFRTHEFDIVRLMKEWMYRGTLDLEGDNDMMLDVSNDDKAKRDTNDESNESQSRTTCSDEDGGSSRAEENDETTRSSTPDKVTINIMRLTKLCTLAEHFEVPKLYHEASKQLVHSLNLEHEQLPIEALIYAFAQGGKHSKVVQILLCYIARFMSSEDSTAMMDSGMPLELVHQLLATVLRLHTSTLDQDSWLTLAQGEDFAV